MQLLVSTQDGHEASCALRGGADIIDVKSPNEEGMGSNFPSAIRETRSACPDATISVTLGAVPNLLGTVSLAAVGAVHAGANYVKVGLLHFDTFEAAVNMMKEVKKAAEGTNTKIIAAGYADYALFNGFDAHQIVKVALVAGCDGVLIDTRTKGKGNLFTYMELDDIKKIVSEAHNRGLSVALSGELNAGDLATVKTLNADIIGVRGAVCSKNDRYGGRVEESAVAKVKQCLLAIGKEPRHCHEEKVAAVAIA